MFTNRKETLHHRRRQYPFILITSLVFSLTLFSACPNGNPNPRLNFGEVSTYMIIYNGNGADSGTAPQAQEKQSGKDLIIANNMAGKLKKRGKYFSGWNTDSKGKGDHYNAGSIYTEDKPLALYAEWDSAVTLEYDANRADSGTAPQGQEKRPGQELAIAGNSGVLKRTGYVFRGWNTQADSKGISYQAGAIYTEDKTITLYAEWWALIEYNANRADSGTAPQGQEKRPGQDLTIADNSGALVRAGYVFKGWNTQVDGKAISYQTGESYTEDKAITLYAEWWVLIEYAANGAASGTVPTAQEKKPGKDLTITGNMVGSFTKQGMYFAGWNTHFQGRGRHYAIGSTYTQDKPLILYVEWGIVIALKYDANGADSGIVPKDQEKQPEKDIIIADNSGTLKRTGYVFYGWNTQKNKRGTHYTPGKIYSEISFPPLTLYAEWYIPIKNKENLNKIRQNLNEDYILQNDIDLGRIPNFESIGSIQKPFKGVFNGAGHTIRNLQVIFLGVGERTGFFRFLRGAWICDLKFNHAIVEGKGGSGDPVFAFAGVGVLGGYAMDVTVKRVIIRNSHVLARLSFAGLLIGKADGCSIEECGVEGEVLGGGLAGGLLGGVNAGTIRRSYARGTVTSDVYAGGLIGGLLGSFLVEDSYASVIVGSGDYFGGLIGLCRGTLRNSYATGKVSILRARGSSIGGLVGQEDDGTIFSSYFDGASTGIIKGVGVAIGTGMPTRYRPSDLTGSDKFLGWDFTGINGKPAIWHWVGTGKWPILQWQYEMQQAP